MNFTHIDNGTGHEHKAPLVFLPGWGFDGKIASLGHWPAHVNLLVPTQFCHPGVVEELRTYLAEMEIDKVALAGWSMGANLAWQFTTSYPGLVSSVTLLAGRSHWPSLEIAAIKADLGGDWHKSMQGFYRKCFLGHKPLYRRFVETMESDYLQRLDIQDLSDCLDYLALSPLVGQAPSGVSVRVVHGRKDVVAPVGERPQIEGAMDKVIDASGHLIFAQPHSYLL